MKNKIKPHYVDFNTAKLLKEKGFKYYCSTSYWKQEFTHNTPGYPLENGETSQENYYDFERYYAPEQHQVVDWLLEKHGIWIDVRYMDDILNFGYTITTIKDNTEQYGLYKFNYPQQAYSAAIDYILLNNLI